MGIESTIIDCTGDSPRIVRLGAITKEMIEEVSSLNDLESVSIIRASGTLPRHYSPRAKVLIDQQAVAGQGLIALSDQPTPAGVIRLASPSSIEEYAHDLYGALRKADAEGLSGVCVFLPRGGGLAEAIRDRLIRAASED